MHSHHLQLQQKPTHVGKIILLCRNAAKNHRYVTKTTILNTWYTAQQLKSFICIEFLQCKTYSTPLILKHKNNPLLVYATLMQILQLNKIKQEISASKLSSSPLYRRNNSYFLKYCISQNRLGFVLERCYTPSTPISEGLSITDGGTDTPKSGESLNATSSLAAPLLLTSEQLHHQFGTLLYFYPDLLPRSHPHPPPQRSPMLDRTSNNESGPSSASICTPSLMGLQPRRTPSLPPSHGA